MDERITYGRVAPWLLWLKEGGKKRKQTKRRTYLRLSAERLPWDEKVVGRIKSVRSK
jgi:hypothetical protein